LGFFYRGQSEVGIPRPKCQYCTEDGSASKNNGHYTKNVTCCDKTIYSRLLAPWHETCGLCSNRRSSPFTLKQKERLIRSTTLITSALLTLATSVSAVDYKKEGFNDFCDYDFCDYCDYNGTKDAELETYCKDLQIYLEGNKFYLKEVAIQRNCEGSSEAESKSYSRSEASWRGKYVNSDGSTFYAYAWFYVDGDKDTEQMATTMMIHASSASGQRSKT